MSSASSTRDPYDALRPWSAITHGAGALAAVLGTVLLVLRARSLTELAGFGVYGLSMVLLYTASTLYHTLPTAPAGRRLLRKLDHCSICLLIAGSYTPICMLALWAGWAFRQARKNKGGCGGSCNNCPHACNKKTELP